jgi:(3S)-malyl-CoA thioesterase
MTAQLRLCRSLLFLPASNARAIEKARTLEADMIVLDLEDAVKPEDKALGRSQVEDAVRQGFGGRPVAVRINATATQWFGEDVVAVRRTKADYVVLAKAESLKEVADAAWLTGKQILAMIETPRGVLDAAAIAQATGGLIAGTNDLSADLHIPPSEGRCGLAYALQRIVLAARAARVAAFDGVYNQLDDDLGLAEQCREGRAYGFDGKSLIHPGQIDTANRIFSPSGAEVEEAMRLIAAASGGAERFEGRMIEQLHVEQARALVAKARL